MPTPPTPDFYTYSWQPLTGAALHDDWIDVSWGDGKTLRCYSLWLVENVAETGFEMKTREGIIDPANLPSRSSVSAATVAGDGSLLIEWADRAPSSVHPGWLRHVADNRHQPDSYLPEQAIWTAATREAPPTIDGEAILDDDRVLLAWLDDLVRFGFARLVNATTDSRFLGPPCGKDRPRPRHQLWQRLECQGDSQPRLNGQHRPKPRATHRSPNSRDTAGVPVSPLHRKQCRWGLVPDD